MASGSDGIKSLLQYRYQAASRAKLSGAKTPTEKTGPECEAVPDTPEKHWPSPLKKTPVKVRGRRKAVISDDDHSLDSASPSSKISGSEPTSPNPSSLSSSTSSPWLSKSAGPRNVRQKPSRVRVARKKSTTSKVSTSQSDSTTSQVSTSQSDNTTSHVSTSQSDSTTSCNGDANRDVDDRLSRLQAEFPTKDGAFLKSVLDENDDYEKAVSAVIAFMAGPDNRTADKPNVTEKRRQMSPCDGESPMKTGPNRKRIRIMSESSNDEASHVAVSSSAQQTDEKLRRLSQHFPERDKLELREALEACGGDLEKAIESLQSDDGDEDCYVLSPRKTGNHHVIHPPPLSTKYNALTNGTTIDDKTYVCVDSGDDDEECDDDDEDEINSEDSDSTADDSVLNFFNTASVDECAIMPGCSRKKAEAIVALQPFKNWDELKSKLSCSRLVGMGVVSGCRQLIAMREVVMALMRKCRKIAEQIEGLVNQLMAGTTLSKGDSQITKQPKLLNSEMELKPYQMVGLNWLVLLHGQHLNGILADEMGLGKTVQAISLLAHLLEEGCMGPHIIVVPSSTIDNWLRELQTWCPALEVILYYGSQEERRHIRYQLMDENIPFNVLVTTYNMTSGTIEDRNLFKKFEFVYAIFDEAHMLKNMSSQRYTSLMRTRAERRLLLTGTPLQNNLVELMSLLCFVMPHMFTSKTTLLKKMFMTLTKGSDERGRYEKERIDQAKNIMKPFVLRRLKIQVLNQMPQKVDYVRKCPLSDDQRTGYDACVDKIKCRLNDLESAPSGLGVNFLMDLRKWANHPLLHRTLYTDDKLKIMSKLMLKDPDHRDANADYILEDMQIMSDFELNTLCKKYPCLKGQTLPSDVVCRSGKFEELDRMLPGMKDKGDRVLLFSQFTILLDILEYYMKERKYKYQRLDGQTPVIDRQDLIDKFNTDTSLFVFLLSTRAGGLGINLTAANTVIMHDIDFNPYNDKQAEDRCHRMGQTRPVSVYKLISDMTIEEDILKTAQYKLRLEQDLTGISHADDSENPSDVASLLRTALNISKTKSSSARPS